MIAVDCYWVGKMEDTNLSVEEEISKKVQSIGQGRRLAVEVGSVRETPINCQAKKVTRCSRSWHVKCEWVSLFVSEIFELWKSN